MTHQINQTTCPHTYTLSSCIHVNTADLLHIMCILVATGVLLGRLECSTMDKNYLRWMSRSFLRYCAWSSARFCWSSLRFRATASSIFLACKLSSTFNPSLLVLEIRRSSCKHFRHKWVAIKIKHQCLVCSPTWMGDHPPVTQIVVLWSFVVRMI